MAKVNEEIRIWKRDIYLEEAVMRDSPSEVAEFYKELGYVDLTAKALGLAARFRGLEMVKTLVEGGATFKYDLKEVEARRRRFPVLPPVTTDDESFAPSLLLVPALGEINRLDKSYSRFGLPPLPLAERLEVLDYFIKEGKSFGFDADEFLFYAYLTGEYEMADVLKKSGAKLSDRCVRMITLGVGGDFWLGYCFYSGKPREDYIRNMTSLLDEIEAQTSKRPKLHFTDKFWEYNKNEFSNAENFRFLLENFKQEKMRKTAMMKDLIMSENVPCIGIAAEFGWLKAPKKRDEMIEFARENGKTEITAWLLDHKNRTADLAAERCRAEKKQERELNAAPDSVTMMKKLWKWEKDENDGTLIITGYKGSGTELYVPERIGQSTVTEIGKQAFSPTAPRITEEQARIRCEITKIVIPNSVRKIAADAFGGSGVCKGGFAAFSSLKEVTLPDELEYFKDKRSAEYAPLIFANFPEITLKIPRSELAELFCKRNGVKFEYK